MPGPPVPPLFPRPRHLEVHGEGPPAGAAVVEEHVPRGRLPAEGFEIELGPSTAVVRHADAAGLRYARATLDQLRHPRAGLPGSPGSGRDGGLDRLPGLRLRDWPDIPVRGYMLDVSRDRVPTRATLERIVGLMARARLNQLQLYTEHTFAYRGHEVVWAEASPITPDDVAWLRQRCADAGIELVPNQNCFGHMERWLRHDAYRHRAECPAGFEIVPGVPRPPAVLAPTPDNARFVLDLLDELLPLFTSRRVHIGCDETFELGRGASRADAERRGVTRVYADHVERLARPLTDRGYEVLVWADVLRQDPSLAGALPQGTVPVVWTYEAPVPAGAPPSIPPEIATTLAGAGIDLAAHSGFTAGVTPIAEAGLPFWVAPGTSAWASLVGRIDNAARNLIDAAEVGLERDASGYLVTDWGDNGHLQPPSVSFGPLLLGGAVAWGLDANRDLADDLPALLDQWAFGGVHTGSPGATGGPGEPGMAGMTDGPGGDLGDGSAGGVDPRGAAGRRASFDPAGDRHRAGAGGGRTATAQHGEASLGATLDELGRLWRRTGMKAFNCSPLEAGLLSGRAHLTLGEPDAAKVSATIERLDAALTAVDRSAPGCDDGAAVRQELASAVRLARHGAYRLLARAGGPAPPVAALRSDLAEAIELQAAAWLARSRPGGLPDSLSRLHATLAEYT